MKKFLLALLLTAGSGFGFDLVDLHPGSALSTVDLTGLSFDDIGDNLFTENVDLTAFPCSASEDDGPTAFRALYSVTAAPEPDYGQLLVPALLVGIVILRRIIRIG